jgi:hypothetical protein
MSAVDLQVKKHNCPSSLARFGANISFFGEIVCTIAIVGFDGPELEEASTPSTILG